MKNEEIEKVIVEHYGEKAIPHKRDTPFADNDLMLTQLDGGITCRAYSPSTSGFFIVEYFGVPERYRLDFVLETKVDGTSGFVSVKQNKYYPPNENEKWGSYATVEVAMYSFHKNEHTFSVTFVSGKNAFFFDVRDALDKYFSVKDGFLWVQK